MQHAIIAIAHPQPILERLDVNVRGMRLDGAGNQLVDQPDHRRFAGEVLEPLGILLGRLGIDDNLAEQATGLILGLGIKALKSGL